MMRYFSTVRYFFEASGIISDYLRYRTDSGHGGQVPDKDGDEVDGLDEGKAYSFLFRASLDCIIRSYIPCRLQEGWTNYR